MNSREGGAQEFSLPLFGVQTCGRMYEESMQTDASNPDLYRNRGSSHLYLKSTAARNTHIPIIGPYPTNVVAERG